jgi:hypothetical protein
MPVAEKSISEPHHILVDGVGAAWGPSVLWRTVVGTISQSPPPTVKVH